MAGIRSKALVVKVDVSEVPTEAQGFSSVSGSADKAHNVTRCFGSNGVYVADQDPEFSVSLGGIAIDDCTAQAELRAAAAEGRKAHVTVLFDGENGFEGDFYVATRSFDVSRDDDWQGVAFDLISYDETEITKVGNGGGLL